MANLERQVTDEEVLQLVAPITETYFAVGTQFRYSNTGFVLLALVVERVAGISYADFLEQHLFQPLAMHHSTLYGSGQSIPDRAYGYAAGADGKLTFADQGICTATKGDGCIYTSVQEYARWHQALCRAGAYAVEPLLEQVQYTLPEPPNWHYGMGWFVSRRTDDTNEMYHIGNTSGFSNLVISIPEKEVLVAHFSNRADNPHLLTGLLDVLQQFPALRLESGLVRELGRLTC